MGSTLVSSDLDILKDHLKHIEEQVDQGHQSAEDILDTMLEKLPSFSLEDDRRAWSQFAHEIHDDYVEFQLPFILHNSFLVSLYGVRCRASASPAPRLGTRPRRTATDSAPGSSGHRRRCWTADQRFHLAAVTAGNVYWIL